MKISNSSNRNFYKEILAKNDLVAAPMAGITNIPFRKIVRKFFDGLIFTEMVSTEGVSRDIDKSLKLAKITDLDKPIIIQLFGKNPQSFAESVKILEDKFDADGYDINAGCPVKKVIKSGSGAYHLKDLKNLQAIITSLRKSTDKPISLKTRLGYEKDNFVYKEILNICHNEGIDALTIHGRTKAELFSGDIHYDKIAEIVRLSKIIIIGNGNVVDYESYKKMKKTGVDGIMIGRKMMKAPWIFKTIKSYPEEYSPNKKELYDLILEIAAYEKEYRGEKYYLDVVRRLAVWFSKGFVNSSDFRKKVYDSKTDKEFFDILNTFFN
ncbi:tRNA-dihydrouridine synthase family protein [Deferribacteraceae bacterium V6Fe1]|jgi:nifR3 family TIM-barrel protein|nr:tRNA-dihydrouridine synthase [Deferribacteraceae bacterium]UOD34164.1 tRNA-dihydrouridine synthase family protein [Deferribacteraceae bacterium V6Fe1]